MHQFLQPSRPRAGGFFKYDVTHVLVVGLMALMLAGHAPAAWAQAEDDGASLSEADEADTSATKLTPDESARVLAQVLPEAPDARYVLLQRQYQAARLLEDRVRFVDIAHQLADAGRGRPGGEQWILNYLNAEFTWGSQGKALEASELFVSDATLALATRASAALRQAYFAAQGHDRAILARLWSRADGLVGQVMKQGSAEPPRMAIDRLQVRSEIERFSGDNAASVATLREAVGLGRRDLQAVRARTGVARDLEVLDAYGQLDGSMGMLTYALVRHGRQQEAINIAQANLSLWRAGQITDALGARWNYRLANSLMATQQFEAGLAAARLSDDMLQRAGSSPASHTRWLARQEVVRGLIGLKRWKEADESYREFLAIMPPDMLARTRASDQRLIALLAAKNGRLEEALETAERSHRFRLRLFGANHPQTQEAAGVRGVVRLARGEISRAMGDYEALFAATLDNPGGWLDLDLRGVRGYVLGIAFDEFMRYVAQQALKGESLDAELTDRAMQIADRTSLGVTQRAITDSTARVLAATPALRVLLEQEQSQRRMVAALFSKLNATLAQEDRLRRETQTPEFKALPEHGRKAHAARLSAVREQIKAHQLDVTTARTVLINQRMAIAQQFPAYADLVTPSTLKPEQLRGLLGAGEALLVIHPTDTATLAWLVVPGGRGGFHASRLTQTDLTLRVADLRKQLDLGSAPPVSTSAPPTDGFYALYRDLVQPLEPQLQGVRSLIIATDGPLASLPLAALLTKAPQGNVEPAWLVRQMAITQLPSSSALQALRRGASPPAAAKALLGFGDPLFKLDPGQMVAPPAAPGAPRLVGGKVAATATRYDAELGFSYANMPALPETRTELLAVAEALGADAKTDLVLGAQATRRAVLDANLLDRRVVAFATHGLMPGELPGVSKPALAMAATSDGRESPLLDLDDVLGLRLNAQWVLLSACNTAAGEQGGASMSGLVRGFFFAGARSVLATHWAVESDSAAALSAATFKAMAKGGVSRSEGLRQAQLAMIDGSQGEGQWRHPFFWAPYALFGDPVR